MLATVAVMVMSQSCQEKPGADKTLKAPVLSSNKTAVTINPTSTDAAFTVSWTSSGENALYKLEIAAKSDSKFADAEYVSITSLSKDFDQKMVAIYAETLELKDSYSLIFRVTASCNGFEDVVSNVIEVKVTESAPAAPELVVPLLAADKVEVIANPNDKNEAVSITWTSAAAGGLTPVYTIELAFNENFDKPLSFPIEGDNMYVSLSGMEIAAFAEENKLGEEFTVYARLIASADGAASVTSNVVSAKVKIDWMIPEKLYIYFWAWEDPKNAKEMEYLGDGVFTWTGQCGQWQFKFITSLDNYWTGYFRDETASDYWTMKDGTKDESMFMLNDKGLGAGLYKITVNCKTLKVTVEAQAEPLPEHLYLDFWGWGDATAAKEMTSVGNGKFTWSGNITRWEFKFTTANAIGDDYWTGYFRDPDASNYWTLKKTSTQTMFKLDDVAMLEGDYTINVDLNDLSVEMVPHIYPIGAFPWGWERDSAEEMTYEGNGLFSWTGAVGEGDFKFLSQTEGEWIGYNRKDAAENYWTAVRCCDQAGDIMFDIASQSLAAGTYKVEFNPFTKAVTLSPVTE